jgi:pyridoxamine 5'-phosphate oxidase
MSTENPNERSIYAGTELDPALVAPDPLTQLAAWIADAATDVPWEAGAFTLATVDPQGRPDARIVLLRGIEDGALQFFTNYDSAKGEQLAANPYAAALFGWPRRHRQVRVRGPVERLCAAESDSYFATRPRGSQLGAWASPQSAVIASREELDEAFAQAEGRFDGRTVERPPTWGGYRLVPEEVELWSGRVNRLHDRVRYTREGAGGWRIERLAP